MTFVRTKLFHPRELEKENKRAIIYKTTPNFLNECLFKLLRNHKGPFKKNVMLIWGESVARNVSGGVFLMMRIMQTFDSEKLKKHKRQ